MKQVLRIFIIILVLTCLLAANPQELNAAPIAPAISVSVHPEVVVPGQAGFAFVSGAYPLDVDARMGNESLGAFWMGSGYVVPFSINHDESFGERSLVVIAENPLTGERINTVTTITILPPPYPEEDISIGANLEELLDPAINQEEKDKLSEVFSQASNYAQWTWLFAHPAPDGLITSHYGANRTYNDSQLITYHTGTDFRRHRGGAVFSVAKGRVVSAEYYEVRGNAVIIDHGYGVYSLYAHLTEIYVELGQYVSAGEQIGSAGSTGRSAGPHLHLEIIVQGNPVDPLHWMSLSPGYMPFPEVPGLHDEGEEELAQ